MSAEILRRAADAIRKDQDIEENLGHIDPSTFDAWLAVADWLDDIDARADGRVDFRRPNSADLAAAIAVARAYLGSES